MPYGYLKNKKGVSAKLARGGGSGTNKKSKTKTAKNGRQQKEQELKARHPVYPRTRKARNTTRWFLSKEHDELRQHQAKYYPEQQQESHEEMPPISVWTCAVCTYINALEDASFYPICAMCGMEDMNSVVRNLDGKDSAEQNQYDSCCPICCEENVPLISLTKTCARHHEPACYQCLRKVYVLDAAESIANYPLTCYHPSCYTDGNTEQKIKNTVVRETQLLNHNLVQTDAELTRYFRFMELAKGHRHRGMGRNTTTAHCPHCDHPRNFNSQGHSLVRIFKCRHCRSDYHVVNDENLVGAVENIQADNIGPNEGWAQCPGCRMLISKGYGCDHMHCIMCGLHFSWEEAREGIENSKSARTTRSNNAV